MAENTHKLNPIRHSLFPLKNVMNTRISRYQKILLVSWRTIESWRALWIFSTNKNQHHLIVKVYKSRPTSNFSLPQAYCKNHYRKQLSSGHDRIQKETIYIKQSPTHPIRLYFGQTSFWIHSLAQKNVKYKSYQLSLKRNWVLLAYFNSCTLTRMYTLAPLNFTQTPFHRTITSTCHQPK